MIGETTINLKGDKLTVSAEVWGDLVEWQLRVYTEDENPLVNSAITASMVLNAVTETIIEKTHEKLKAAGFLDEED